MSKNERMTRFSDAVLNFKLFTVGLLGLTGLIAPVLPAWSQAADPASAPEATSAASAPAQTATLPIAGPSVVLPAAAPPLTSPTTLLPPPTWAGLTRAQKTALAPLERDWEVLGPVRKTKWLEVAARYSTLPIEEQARLHQRMREWALLSPAERQQARIGYQAAQQMTIGDRQAKWEAYQALSPERRQELADKAVKKQTTKPVSPVAKSTAPSETGVLPKSNLVPTPPKNQPAKAVATSVLQAKPGASTVLITQVKTVPAHLQPGQTKIFADPELVDSKTLLPKRRPVSQ